MGGRDPHAPLPEWRVRYAREAENEVDALTRVVSHVAYKASLFIVERAVYGGIIMHGGA